MHKQYISALSRSQPSSLDPKNPDYHDVRQDDRRYQPAEDLVASLKNENRDLRRNLGLYESSASASSGKKQSPYLQPSQQQDLSGSVTSIKHSDMNFPYYTYGTTSNSKNHSPNSGVRQRNKSEINPLSLDFRTLLAPEDPRASAPKKDVRPTSSNRTVSEGCSQKENREKGFFEFSDFDEYIYALSKPVRQVDVRKKVLELKSLAKSIKAITEDTSDANFNDLLKKLGEDADMDKKPTYKVISERGPDSYISSSKPQRNSKEQVYEYQVPENHYEKVKRSGNLSASGMPSLQVSPVKLTNPNAIPEHSDKNGESFEVFLSNQGVAPSLFNPEGGESPILRQSLLNNGSIGPYVQSSFAISPGPVPGAEPRLSQQYLNGSSTGLPNESQSPDLMSSLQFFLLQNLKELGEIKDILKDGETASLSKSPSRKAKLKKEKTGESEAEESSRVHENEDHEFEKKLQEAQTERLIKKLQVMTKKVQDLEKENERYTFLDQALRRSLKIGNVRISSHIKYDLDTTRLTLENLENEFAFEEKLLTITSTALRFESRNIDKGQSQGPGKPEDEYKMTLDDVESITYIEKPGSNFYLIQALETDRGSKSRSQDSIRFSNASKGSPFDSKQGVYIVQIQDQREIVAWELAFLMFNFKLLARNITSSYNKKEFLQSLRMFLNRYMEYNGDNSYIFGDLSPIMNNQMSSSKLALNHMTSSVNSISSPQSTASPAFPKQPPSFDFLQEAPLDLNRSSKSGSSASNSKGQTLLKSRPEDIELKAVTAVRKSSQKLRALPLRQSITLEEEEAEEDEQIEEKEWKIQRAQREQREERELRAHREQVEQREEREQREIKELREQREQKEQRRLREDVEQRERKELNEGVSEQSQFVDDHDKQEDEIPSLDEEFSPEENKSNFSNLSNGKKEKTPTPPAVEEPPLVKAINTLLEGAAFEKYGKWGGKNEKLIRISNDFLTVEWKDPKKPRQTPDSITIDSIERIEVGSRSTYFAKKKMSDTELNLCFSIISEEKSLHLKAPDLSKREAFVESLQLALNDRFKIKKMSELAASVSKEKTDVDK